MAGQQLALLQKINDSYVVVFNVPSEDPSVRIINMVGPCGLRENAAIGERAE